MRVAEGRKTEVIQGVAGFRIFPEPGGCYTLPNQARYQTSLNPEIFGCFAGVRGEMLSQNCSRAIIQDGSEKSNGFFCHMSGLSAVGVGLSAVGVGADMKLTFISNWQERIPKFILINGVENCGSKYTTLAG